MPSGAFVDLSAVANVVEVEAAAIQIEFVKHPVIAHPQFVFRTTDQVLVGKRGKSGFHFIHFALHVFTNGERQCVK